MVMKLKYLLLRRPSMFQMGYRRGFQRRRTSYLENFKKQKSEQDCADMADSKHLVIPKAVELVEACQLSANDGSNILPQLAVVVAQAILGSWLKRGVEIEIQIKLPEYPQRQWMVSSAISMSLAELLAAQDRFLEGVPPPLSNPVAPFRKWTESHSEKSASSSVTKIDTSVNHQEKIKTQLPCGKSTKKSETSTFTPVKSRKSDTTKRHDKLNQSQGMDTESPRGMRTRNKDTPGKYLALLQSNSKPGHKNKSGQRDEQEKDDRKRRKSSTLEVNKELGHETPSPVTDLGYGLCVPGKSCYWDSELKTRNNERYLRVDLCDKLSKGRTNICPQMPPVSSPNGSYGSNDKIEEVGSHIIGSVIIGAATGQSSSDVNQDDGETSSMIHMPTSYQVGVRNTVQPNAELMTASQEEGMDITSTSTEISMPTPAENVGTGFNTSSSSFAALPDSTSQDNDEEFSDDDNDTSTTDAPIVDEEAKDETLQEISRKVTETEVGIHDTIHSVASSSSDRNENANDENDDDIKPGYYCPFCVEPDHLKSLKILSEHTKRYKSRESLNQHIRHIHSKMLYCARCSFSSNRGSVVLRHLERRHKIIYHTEQDKPGPPQSIFTCLYCVEAGTTPLRKCTRYKNFKIHIENNHMIKSEDKVILKCPYCEFAAYTAKGNTTRLSSQLLVHMFEIHHKVYWQPMETDGDLAENHSTVTSGAVTENQDTVNSGRESTVAAICDNATTAEVLGAATDAVDVETSSNPNSSLTAVPLIKIENNNDDTDNLAGVNETKIGNLDDDTENPAAVRTEDSQVVRENSIETGDKKSEKSNDAGMVMETNDDKLEDNDGAETFGEIISDSSKNQDVKDAVTENTDKNSEEHNITETMEGVSGESPAIEESKSMENANTRGSEESVHVIQPKWLNVDEQPVHKTITQHDKRYNKYKCSFCWRKFPEHRLRQAHIQRVHPGAKEYLCSHCGMAFKLRSSLRAHTWTKHKIQLDDQAVSVCEICGEVETNITMRTHLRSHRRANSHSCDICGHEAPSLRMHYHHTRTHQTDGWYTCYLCTYRCRSFRLLAQHVNKKHRGIEFKCPLCHLVAATQAKLDKHIKLKHPSGQRRHYCETCDKQFANNKTYANHLFTKHGQLEGGRSVELCPVCPYRALTKAKLKIHMRVHEKMLKCKTCEAELENQDLMHAHVLTFHKGKAFACDLCNFTTIARAVLQRHKRKKHAVLVRQPALITIQPTKKLQDMLSSQTVDPRILFTGAPENIKDMPKSAANAPVKFMTITSSIASDNPTSIVEDENFLAAESLSGDGESVVYLVSDEGSHPVGLAENIAMEITSETTDSVIVSGNDTVEVFEMITEGDSLTDDNKAEVDIDVTEGLPTFVAVDDKMSKTEPEENQVMVDMYACDICSFFSQDIEQVQEHLVKEHGVIPMIQDPVL